MSKKQLNTKAILSELSGQSVFFGKQTERNSEHAENRSEKRTALLSPKRRTKRYSFEFYEDQITRLKQIKIRAEMKGETIFLSEIARQALEEFLEKQPTERTEERTEIRSEKRAYGTTFRIPNGKTNGFTR